MKQPRTHRYDMERLAEAARREKPRLAAGIDAIKAEREARVKEARELEFAARRLHRSVAR